MISPTMVQLISWGEDFCLCFCFYVLLFVYLLFSLLHTSCFINHHVLSSACFVLLFIFLQSFQPDCHQGVGGDGIPSFVLAHDVPGIIMVMMMYLGYLDFDLLLWTDVSVCRFDLLPPRTENRPKLWVHTRDHHPCENFGDRRKVWELFLWWNARNVDPIFYRDRALLWIYWYVVE